jgi:ribosomal protein L37AE/L43A
MQCPRCSSDDVKRSRRKFWERFVLALFRAQIFRCRDCKKRFWTGINWGPVILAGLAFVMVSGVAIAMVVAHRSAMEAARVPRARPLPRARRRALPMPSGLPPLSSVPPPR